jgi:hypothetical protein
MTISIVSGINGGEGGWLIGIIGFTLLGLAIFGFILSYKGLREIDVYYRFPMIGSITNCLMLLVFLFIYILGIIK